MKLSSFTISILFTFISLASSFKTASVMSYYAVFTNDFVERFCENKERPELKCDGKCALSQMLSQKADDEKTPINLDLLKNETVLFIGSLTTYEFVQQPRKVLQNVLYRVLYDFHFFERIKHPPEV
ncbi:hypothetical protein CLV90_3373 [Maribacter spongiicola]|uniref:Uncharacterized protein n=1 Tax=Maribacter spongiicola TaxID=1206753 RepID=A0A4R7JRR5_9FLAO|nr:hypothetical protein [Maribacter spongiicola]TDT40524.1 hypothetical protein CLV90_3373 [Maribacter spongiicola]